MKKYWLIIFCLFLLALCIFFLNVRQPVTTASDSSLSIAKLMQAEQYDKLTQAYHTYQTLDSVYLCNETPLVKQQLEKAAKTATKMFHLEGLKGVSLGELWVITLFIEHTLPQRVTEGIVYFPKENTGLVRDVEYDPHTKSVLIHFPSLILGKGVFKIVSKSILYDPMHPYFVARSVYMRGKNTSTWDTEYAISTALSGKPGLVSTCFSTERVANASVQRSIITQLYNQGSLSSFLKTKPKLTFKEQVHIMYQMAQGLSSMHQAGYTHNDLGPKNYLVDVSFPSKEQREIHCVIADFGRSFVCRETKGKKAQGNKLYYAPEAFDYASLSGTMYEKTDIFTMGCAFHAITSGKRFPWQKKKYVHESMRGDNEYAKARLIEKIAHYRKKQRKKGRLSLEHSIEQLILKMVHPNPSKRPSAQYVLKKLEKIEHLLQQST